jgi:hypothetical protein
MNPAFKRDLRFDQACSTSILTFEYIDHNHYGASIELAVQRNSDTSNRHRSFLIDELRS